MADGNPVVLSILDGWGHNPDPRNNAVAMARTPNFDKLWNAFPHTLIRTDGPFVGLPDGQMGNSEVGHLNIGAGRIVKMDITRIDELVQSGNLRLNPVLQGALAHGKSTALHLMGLLSDGGVHSQITHLYALLRAARQEGVENVYIHAFTDGRDTPPDSGVNFVCELQQQLAQIGCGKLATLSGRYYAMDRDRRWERVNKAFLALVAGQGNVAQDPVAAMEKFYQAGVTDEFVLPTVMVGAHNKPVGTICDGDAVLFFNFRADRARQLTLALNDPDLAELDRGLAPRQLHYVTMTRYDNNYPYPVIIEKQFPERILGEICADHAWSNLRVAETEKYPHVTYFFNGGREQIYPGEEREMVPSPKVATYDLQPEMSAVGVCDVVVRGIRSRSFNLIVVNFANGDMVGHAGVPEAAVKACETVDSCLSRIHDALRETGGQWIVTADHGNAELMVDPETGKPHTYHTTFPVPLILASEYQGRLSDGGSLRDISPTILGCLGVPQPDEMTGKDLRESA